MSSLTRPDPTPIQPDQETVGAPAADDHPEISLSNHSIPTRQSRRSRPFIHQRQSSSTSIDSTTFLDHRHQPQSISRNMSISHSVLHQHRRRSTRPRRPRPDGQYSSNETSEHDEEQEEEDDETMRLMSQSFHRQSFAPWTKPRRQSLDESARLLGSSERLDTYGSRPQTRGSGTSPLSRAGRRSSPTRSKYAQRYSHINHPSSVPSSIGSPPPPDRPRQFSLVGTGADGETVSMPLAQRAQRRLTQSQEIPSRSNGDVLIDIEAPEQPHTDLSALPPISQSPTPSSTHSSTAGSVHSRRKTYKAEEDVCFPTEEPSPKAPWPDYEVLEEWAAQESKNLDEGSEAVRNGQGGFLSRDGNRKVSEPVMVDGRYRRAYTFPSAVPYEVCHFEFVANNRRMRRARIDSRSSQINWPRLSIHQPFPN
jgi:hypothetical protein